MLNFSKINIFFIYFIFVLISVFSVLNFQNKDNILINKKVNLGLDLQGGSYLLLEIDTEPLIKERIQSKSNSFQKFLNENDIKYSNFKIEKNSLLVSLKDHDKFEGFFFNKKDNSINPYIDKYNAYELDYKSLNEETLKIFFLNMEF